MPNYKPYPKYKESGVTWLGEVPEGWEVKRLGQYFKDRREKVSDKDFEALSVTKNGIVPQLESAAKTNDGDNRKKVCKGDYVINSRSDRKGSSGLSSLDGSVSLINIILEPCNIEGNFIHHLFRSYPFQEEFYRYGKGIVADLWSTNYSEMKNININIPSKEEQTKIATYLDQKTKTIDTLISKQQTLIELLKEKRQALISHVVTKGLDKNVPMKESGVAWLGEVPEGWEVKRIKFNVILQNQKVTIDKQVVIALENIESKSGKYIKTESSYKGEDVAFERGDILFGKLRPYLAKVFRCENNGIAFGDLLVFRPTKGIDTSFAFYSMLSDTFISIVDSSTYGTKMPRASVDFINEMPMPTPPLNQQTQIANYLDQKTKKIDTLINKSTQAIKLLKERRTALVSAVVTGKIDVREEIDNI